MLRVEPLIAEQSAFEICHAAAEVDAPGFPFGTCASFVGRMRRPWPGNVLEQYQATLDGVPVGHLELGLPQVDNLANVNVQLNVHPDHRRRGAGRALFAYAVDRTRALGRRHLIGPTSDQRREGAAFAAAMGAAPGLAELRSRLVVAAVGDEPAPVADGYRVARWIGAAPEEYLDDMAYLDGRLNGDAPTGDLAWEPETVDAARIRGTEEALRIRRRTTFHTGAVHEGTGRLIAWTMISGADDTPEQAWQGITIVDPDHRGHGLGHTIKIENLRYARRRRPALRVVDTFNAAGNEHMLRINRLMGFRTVDAWTQWQVTV